jgi:MoaA/NifB/PqqE/SkfB family radical SAM enzyme
MDTALAIDLVDQAADLRVFSQCAWTGGEPLIFFSDVLKVCEKMKERGFPFSMISSCYWASTDQATIDIIEPLVDHGMVVFTASHDPSHKNWVPESYITRACDAVLRRDRNVVICSSFYNDTDRLEEIFPQYVDNPLVVFVNRVVLPKIGRATRRNITPANYKNIINNFQNFACYKRIYHDLTVFWDGEAYPCCSVYNRATPGISLGNVYKDSLADIWDRLEGSLLYRTIKQSGFAALYELLKKRRPDLQKRLPDPSSSVGPCNLCHDIFSDVNLTAEIMEVMQEEELERISGILNSVNKGYGEDVEELLLQNVLNRT